MINRETLGSMISAYSEDKEMLDIIFNALKHFEEYHQVIYEMETKMLVYSYDSMDKDDYQSMVTEADKLRTMKHNAVISSVSMLNKIAEKEKLPPFYDGIVSKERPYRRQVANAVLDFAEEIIKNRR